MFAIVLKNLRSYEDKKGLLLILISSCVLGIWAVSHTIALRNLLLIGGSLLAIAYWSDFFRLRKDGVVSHFFDIPNRFYYLPFILTSMMLLWTVVHFFWFSEYPERQLHELTSTWFRAFLALLLGSATGLALLRNRSCTWLLWLGLLVSFLVLMAQYVPKALDQGSLFAVDLFGDYIYWAKFNGALAGSILFAGILGLIIDQRRGIHREENAFDKHHLPLVLLRYLYLILGVTLPLYAFVFIFSTKNGVGALTILLVFWLAFLAVLGLKHALFSSNGWAQFKFSSQLVVMGLAGSLLFVWLITKHIEQNPGWGTLFEDLSIATQIDQYTHWQNPPERGLPRRGDGSAVTSNTYERVSWGMVGLRLIQNNWKGIGILRSLPQSMQKQGIEFNAASYTHSGWIDFGLAFGLPGLIMLPVALSLCVLLSLIHKKINFRATIFSLALILLILFSVGEYGFQHGIEILFFISAFLSTLIWGKSID
jgi:hypothetical protein